MIYITKYHIPLGNITLASDGESLVGLWFDGQKYYGYGIDDDYIFKDDLVIFDKTKLWLKEYFAGNNPNIKELSISFITGSSFQKLVWLELICIPYGKVISYKELAILVAKKMGKNSMSCQAIGNAIGHNPISIIVPCHRVIGSNGKLMGYVSGIGNKKAIMELEKRSVYEEEKK